MERSKTKMHGEIWKQSEKEQLYINLSKMKLDFTIQKQSHKIGQLHQKHELNKEHEKIKDTFYHRL